MEKKSVVKIIIGVVVALIVGALGFLGLKTFTSDDEDFYKDDDFDESDGEDYAEIDLGNEVEADDSKEDDKTE